MKESKKFFDRNHLNKGYKELPKLSSKSSQNTSSKFRKKYQSFLPPIEVIEYYEELYPGTLATLLSMAKKEQSYRHSLNMLDVRINAKSLVFGRVCSLIYIVFVAITSITLVLIGSIWLAAIFITISFASIGIISFFYSRNSSSIINRSRLIKSK